MQYHYMETVII